MEAKLTTAYSISASNQSAAADRGELTAGCSAIELLRIIPLGKTGIIAYAFTPKNQIRGIDLGLFFQRDQNRLLI